jgi:hypothetical protein
MKASGKGIKKEGHHLATGRIRDFEKAGYTVETLEDKINEYFDSDIPDKEETVTYFNQGRAITDNDTRVFTFPGLCLWLGLSSRQDYWEKMKDPKNPYSLPLKKGHLRLQRYLEALTLRNGNPAGSMFILKNMDYSDQTTINQNVKEIKTPEIVTQDKETNKHIRKVLDLTPQNKSKSA